MNAGFTLTRGRATFLTRMLCLIAALLFSASVLLQLAPTDRLSAMRDVHPAAVRQSGVALLVFPRFGELQSERTDPFSYRELSRVQVPLRQRERESESELEQSNTYDLSGLELIGTAPGSGHGVALVRDQRTNQVRIVEPGAELRGLQVREVTFDKLSLGTGSGSDLILTPVAGSALLSEQLRGHVTEAGPGNAVAATTPAVTRPAPASTPAGPRPQRSLGVSGYILTPAKQRELGLEQTGLFITAVQDEQSPVHVNDVLLSIGGHNIASIPQAQAMLQQLQGAAAEVLLLRDGSKVSVSVSLR